MYRHAQEQQPTRVEIELGPSVEGSKRSHMLTPAMEAAKFVLAIAWLLERVSDAG